MPKVKSLQFASTADMLKYSFVVKMLTGTVGEVARRAVEWGYDGIEFMPDPERIPDPEPFARALKNAGAVMPVVNTGRIAAQGMALLHEDRNIRRKSVEGFKNILNFAGYFKARVDLGAARGPGISGAGKEELDKLVEDVFRELTSGKAPHIHLYDPSRWPPGVLPEKEALDWPHIVKVLQEEGFSGSSSVVIVPEGDPEPVARKSVAYLGRLFGK